MPLLRELKRIQHRDETVHCKIASISLSAVRKCGLWTLSACLDFAQMLKLIEVSDLEDTVQVIEKGQAVRDQYKGQSLDEVIRNRVPLLELFPARYRSIVNSG